ncbi:hypothetical protein J6590_051131 [Homalodisca vitripennis]|nr:hypothetical protein J6590_051131 [Homalodisca vitripennis]
MESPVNDDVLRSVCLQKKDRAFLSFIIMKTTLKDIGFLKKLTKDEINAWKCNTCKDSAPWNIAHSSPLPETSFVALGEAKVPSLSLTRHQNRDEENSTAAISELELRLSNRTDQEETDLETSLTLAAEAGHLLLAKNCKLEKKVFKVRSSLAPELTTTQEISREVNKKGSVAIYVNDSLENEEVTDKTIDTACELSMIHINSSKTQTYLLGVYRPPNSNLNSS